MQAQELIESYVDDVALRLPRKLRNDVGLELRTLLSDQLKATAEETGRPADEQMALDLLRRFGRPDDVASSYRPRGFNLVEPEDAPLFVKLATICVAVQWALTLPPVFRSEATVGDWWLGWGLGALWWVGALLLYFGGAAWIRRRSPIDANTGRRPWTHWILWLPMSEDWRPTLPRVQPRAAKVELIIAAIVTAFFAAPAWLLGLFLTDASWAEYDGGFSRRLLVPLIALLIARIAFAAAVIADSRRRAPTETLRFCLWAAFVGLLYWALLGWDIFAAAGVDAVFKAWLAVFLLVNTIQIGGWVRRALARVRPLHP